MIDRKGESVILVLGAPRSGTTWLAKIFDSHPDVIYRHEPDTVLRSDRIPVICTATRQAQLADVREYLSRLLDLRDVKSAGSLPVFPKRYRSAPMDSLHTLLIYGSKFAGRIAWRNVLSIPDFLRDERSTVTRYVLKSVSSRGRIKPFSEALPNSRIVFLVRHPCGQVASTVNGIASGKFERTIPLAEVVLTDEARQLGMTATDFERLDIFAQCAWHWAILNQKALNDLPQDGRAKVMRYEDLCTAPEREAKELFKFSGLGWNEQSERFVRRSTTADDTGGFYRIARNSLTAAQRWRTSLDGGVQRRILDIAGRVPVGRMFDA